MMINALPLKIIKRWGYAAVLSIPVLAVQAVLPSLSSPLLGDFTSGAVYAADEDDKKPERKTKRVQAINQQVYKKLTGIQELIDAKDDKGALKLLDELYNSGKKLNDAEQATILNLYAFLYYGQDKPHKALEAYKKIITLDQAADGTILQARYSLAQMYFATEQFKPGVDALLEWFKYADAPTSSAYIMLGQGYYQLQDYDKAIVHVDKAISMYKEKGKVPKEGWFALQRFLYQEKKDYNKVISILKELITYYPKKQHWTQLSAMYGELENQPKQLAAYETAYVQGLLDNENELTRMAYIFLANDVPYKAAKVLDKAIKEKKVEATSKNLQLLGNAWRAAQEVKKAIPEMAKAADKSDNGELWTQLGSLYLSNDSFNDAVKAIKAGLDKGGVKRADQANLALGMAYFNLKNYTSARKAFSEAKSDKRSADTAKQWIEYMDKEIARQKSIMDS